MNERNEKMSSVKRESSTFNQKLNNNPFEVKEESSSLSNDNKLNLRAVDNCKVSSKLQNPQLN